MKYLASILLFVFFTFTSNAAENLPEAFLGKWKSDATRSLTSLKNSTQINSTDFEFFKSDVFGQQVFEFKSDEYATYFEKDKPPFNFIRYNIIEAGDNYFVLLSTSKELNITIKQKWILEGEYIRTYIDEYGFSEYFRRIQ